MEVSNVAKSKKRKTRRISNACDVHHLCYQRRHWSQGWCRKLREHAYCRVEIPRDTLHRRIHEFIGNVTTPSEENCQVIYESIETMLRFGEISLRDKISRRLEVLAILLESLGETRTSQDMNRQLEVTTSFYYRPG